MREVNASYARMGEIELRLEPSPPPRQPAIEPPPAVDPEDEGRRYYQDLLHSSGVDPAPFIEADKKLRAA